MRTVVLKATNKAVGASLCLASVTSSNENASWTCLTDSLSPPYPIVRWSDERYFLREMPSLVRNLCSAWYIIEACNVPPEGGTNCEVHNVCWNASSVCPFREYAALLSYLGTDTGFFVAQTEGLQT